MKKALHLFLAAILAAGSTSLAFADASNPSADQRLAGRVRHELAMIPQVTVFDNLGYRVDGGTVTLYGQVRNAVVKDEAQSSLKHLEGVEHVDNRIEVLPASFNDDRIRRQVARALFNDPRLFNYAVQPVAPIRIIVKNGHVNLEGVVRTEGDKNDAFIRANTVPGVFSVENNLQVEQSKG
ncbi:MAG TPA: BON domain-containing protein [Candidatus Angelobacter sp.]|nr:BON domain-containing protein [Candidatus Angelobacter sp.]